MRFDGLEKTLKGVSLERTDFIPLPKNTSFVNSPGTERNPDAVTRYDPPLDRGIEPMVTALADAGIETFESCEGGAGHAYPEPTVRFHGDRSEGFRALAVALQCGLRVRALRRTWPINDGEPTGPWWEMTFATKAPY